MAGAVLLSLVQMEIGMARKRTRRQRPVAATALKKQSEERYEPIGPVVPEDNGVGDIQPRTSLTFSEYKAFADKFCDFMGWANPVHIGRGILAVAATVIPDNALEIIENHHIENNRNKKDRRVSIYASDMKHDRWPQTHQGLAFSYNLDKGKWEMYDGHNRCQAALTAEVDFKTLIFFMPPSFSEEAKPKTDTGASRNIRDAAAIMGMNVSTRWPVIVRGIAFGGTNFNKTVSNDAIFDAYEIIKDSVDFTLKAFNKSLAGLSTKGVMAAVGRAYYHVDHEKLEQFVKIVFSGLATDPSHVSAVKLARWLVRDQRGGGIGQYETYCMAASAIQAFVRGEEIQRLSPVRVDPFALPEEIEWRIASIS